MYTGTTGAADPTSGLSLLLPAVAAAFPGATSIEPGRFNPWGATLAVYFLVTGITGPAMFGIQTYVQELVPPIRQAWPTFPSCSHPELAGGGQVELPHLRPGDTLFACHRRLLAHAWSDLPLN